MDKILAILISLCQTYDVPVSLATAVIQRESNYKVQATRYEPHLLGRWERRGYSAKFLASSHSYTQILGIHYAKYSIPESKAYEPEVHLELAILLMRNHLDTCHKKYSQEKQIFRCVLTRWNGVSPAGRKYAEEVLKTIY